MSKTLAELKAANLPRLDWQELVTIKPGEVLPAEDVEAMREYFAHFLPPGPCVMCGEAQTGGLLAQFTGQAKFTWGLVNGEGFCDNCKYPARALHQYVGPIEFVNLVLQYHPDELSEGKP